MAYFLTATTIFGHLSYIFACLGSTTIGILAEMPKESTAAVFSMQGAFYRAFSLVNGAGKWRLICLRGCEIIRISYEYRRVIVWIL